MMFKLHLSFFYMMVYLLVLAHDAKCAPTQTKNSNMATPCNSHNRNPCATFPDLCSAGGGLCVVKEQTCEYQCVCPPDGRVGRDCTSTPNNQPVKQMGNVVESLVIFPEVFQDMNHVAKSDDFKVNVTKTTTKQPTTTKETQHIASTEHSTFTSAALVLTSKLTKDSTSLLTTTLQSATKKIYAVETSSAKASTALNDQISKIKVTSSATSLNPGSLDPPQGTSVGETPRSNGHFAVINSTRQANIETFQPSLQTKNSINNTVGHNSNAEVPVKDIRQMIQTIRDSLIALASNNSDISRKLVTVFPSVEESTKEIPKSHPLTVTPAPKTFHKDTSPKSTIFSYENLSTSPATEQNSSNVNNSSTSNITEDFPVLFSETIGSSHHTQGSGANLPLSVQVERVFIPIEPFQRSGI